MAIDANLNRKVAIVTGANSGIGRGIAEALAAEGTRVVVAGRTADRNDSVAETIRAAGGTALSVTGDMTQETDIIELVDRTLEEFGQIDICVANAGGIETVGAAPIDKMDTHMWRYVLALNLDAAFYLYREALRHMIPASNGGSLISVSSVGSIRNVSPSFHYASAKAGLNGLTMALADYLGPLNIRINAILPGFVDSAATAAMLGNPAVRDGIIKRIPLRKIGSPEDVGELAVFLAGDRASYITGQTFVIDGGQSTLMISDSPRDWTSLCGRLTTGRRRRGRVRKIMQDNAATPYKV